MQIRATKVMCDYIERLVKREGIDCVQSVRLREACPDCYQFLTGKRWCDAMEFREEVWSKVDDRINLRYIQIEYKYSCWANNRYLTGRIIMDEVKFIGEGLTQETLDRAIVNLIKI